MGGTRAGAGIHCFRTTRWNVVASAAGGDREALGELCAAYWQPLYWHVRRMGYCEADAQDLVQSFFCRLLEGRLVQSADPGRGRFRTFLLTALRRFVINEWKRGRAAKRGGGQTAVSINAAEADAGVPFEPSHNLSPDELFERRWAVQVLENAMKRLEQQHRQAGKGDWFADLIPHLTADDEAMTYQSLAERLGGTPAALKMAVSRLRKELARLVREEVRRTVGRDEEVEGELQRLALSLQG